METLLRVAAVLGVLVALSQVGRTGWRLLRGGVELLVAGEMARTRARRGDLTGMEEAEREMHSARRVRIRAGGELAGWVALLAVPPFTPWTLHIWAAVALFWIVFRLAAGEATGVARQGRGPR
jgi:hypothetical protein